MTTPSIRRHIAASASYLMLVLLAPVGIPEIPGAARGAPMSRHACVYGSWAPVTWLESVGSLGAATRFPAVAAPRETPLLHDPTSASAPAGYAVGVAGSPAIQWPTDSGRPMAWPPQLRAIRFDGERFSGPEEGFWYAYPHAAVDDWGTLHVVWAEPDTELPRTPTALQSELPELRSLWYATLRAGRWGRAVRIYQGRGLEWDETRPSRLLVDGRNGLHVAFGSLDSLGYHLIHLNAPSAPARRWRSTAVPSATGASYLDLAVGSDSNVAIVFVTGAALPRPRTNALALTRSNDGGATWTQPAVISRPEEEGAIEPHAFFDGSSMLRVEWVQQASGSFVGGNVRHAVISGMERRSTTQLALPSDVMTSHSQAAVDACGTLHVFTVAYPQGRAELLYARLAADGWTPWARPFDVPGGHASIAASGALIHVVWHGGTRLPSADGVRRSGLAHSTLLVDRPEDPARRR